MAKQPYSKMPAAKSPNSRLHEGSLLTSHNVCVHFFYKVDGVDRLLAANVTEASESGSQFPRSSYASLLSKANILGAAVYYYSLLV